MDYESDALLKWLVSEIKQDEARPQILNPARMLQFRYCADTMEAFFGREALSFETAPHDPYPSCGTITVVTNELTVPDPERFARAAALASNFEVYPKLDGTLVLAFMFYGLTVKLEG